MILGIVIGLIEIFVGISDGTEASKWMDSPWSFLYGLIMMVWVTCFIESWKRKQNTIANAWLVRDVQTKATENGNFRSETMVDPDTQHKRKVALKSAYKRQLLIGIPFSVLFMAAVVAAQILLQSMNLSFNKDAENQPFFWVYIPSVINGFLIVVFGMIYTKASYKIVMKENH